MFNISDEEIVNEINIDELYEKKKTHDISCINNFNKILSRIHKKIKHTSRLHLTEHFCWFIVPEFLLGIPCYNQSMCIAYVIDKLQNNGFIVRYTHPNMLFISWNHWIPQYVKDEIKKKTGQIIDNYGNIINNNNNEKNKINNNFNKSFADMNINETLTNKMIDNKNIKNEKNKNIKDINTYKPTGNFIYNTNIINSINK